MLNVELKGKQREVLALPASGHIVVLGTAGSGKTILSCTSLKNKTFGKVLQIIQEILIDKNLKETIAKKYRVDAEVLDVLIKYLK